MLAEVAGLAGFDYVVIDMQHGLSDYGDVVGMLQALARTPAVPLVRVPWNEPGIIGRVLDAGALGVIIPLVNSADEARSAVAACRYPPDGSRSFGPLVARIRHGATYHESANSRRRLHPDDRDAPGRREPRRDPRRPGHRGRLRRTGGPLAVVRLGSRSRSGGRGVRRRSRPRRRGVPAPRRGAGDPRQLAAGPARVTPSGSG